MRPALYDVIRRNLPAVPDRPYEPHRPSPSMAEGREFGIDRDTGLSIVGGNPGHYRELLEELSTSANRLLDISRRAGRIEDRREPAHSLHGAAGMLGAHRLAAVAVAIESASEASAGTPVDEARTRSLHEAIVLVEQFLEQDDSDRN